MKVLRVLACAIASGLMLALAMPPVGWWPLGWFALVPLIWSVQRTRMVWGFIGGILASVVAASTLAFGLMPLPYRAPGEPNWVFGGYALFGLLLAVFCAVLGEGRVVRFRYLPIFAAFAVCLEASLMVILPVHLALSQYRQPFALWIASIGGIWAVSYLVWLTNLLLAKSLLSFRLLWKYALAWSVLVAALLAGFHFPNAPANGLRVAVLQTTSSDGNALAALNRRAGKARADLSVWPELSGIEMAPSGDGTNLRLFSLAPGQPPFVTSFEDANRPKPHNAAALFEGGVESAVYFKRKPFAGEATLHQAGSLPLAVAGAIPIGINICFDSCYPAVMRDTVFSRVVPIKPGEKTGPIRLIAIPTEDPVSTNGVIQALHAAYLPFRAAELGMPMARADISAYSMIVDPNGKILGELPPGQNVLVRRVSDPHNTFYRQCGDWFLYACLIICVGGVLPWVRSLSRFIGSVSRASGKGPAN